MKIKNNGRKKPALRIALGTVIAACESIVKKIACGVSSVACMATAANCVAVASTFKVRTVILDFLNADKSEIFCCHQMGCRRKSQ